MVAVMLAAGRMVKSPVDLQRTAHCFVRDGWRMTMDEADTAHLTMELPTGTTILTNEGVALVNTAVAAVDPLLLGFFPVEEREASIVRCFFLVNLLQVALTKTNLGDAERRLISRMTADLMAEG